VQPIVLGRLEILHAREHLPQPAAEELVARLAPQLLGAAVDVGQPPVAVDGVERIRDALQDLRRSVVGGGKGRFRLLPLGPVAHDLEEAGNRAVAQRHHQARAPEAAAIPVLVPALVLGPACFPGLRHLGLRRAALPVLGGEQQAAIHAQGFGLLPAEQVAGARVPAGDPAVEVDGEDGVVGRALEDGVAQGAIALGRVGVSVQADDVVPGLWRLPGRRSGRGLGHNVLRGREDAVLRRGGFGTMSEAWGPGRKDGGRARGDATEVSHGDRDGVRRQGT
jgi:hypothetical protein